MSHSRLNQAAQRPAPPVGQNSEGLFCTHPPSKQQKYTKMQLPAVISLSSQWGQRSALFYNTAFPRQALLQQTAPSCWRERWRSALISLSESCHATQIIFSQSHFDSTWTRTTMGEIIWENKNKVIQIAQQTPQRIKCLSNRSSGLPEQRYRVCYCQDGL